MSPINVHLLTELVVVMEVMVIDGHCTQWAHLWIVMSNKGAISWVNRLNRDIVGG